MPRTIEWGLTKDIVNGIVITFFIFAISAYIPFLGIFGIVFLPLPILFYRLKLGRKDSAIVPVSVIIIVAVIIGKLSGDLIFYTELLLLGFVLGELFELDISIEKTTLYTCCSVIFSAVFCLIIYSNIANLDIYKIISDYVAKNLELILALYKDLGIADEDIQTISNSIESIQYVLVRIIPALIIASTLIIIWANILLSKPLLIARKMNYPNFGPLNLWKAPDNLVWGFIVSGLMLILPSKPIKMVGLNGVIIFLAVYFFQGIAVVSYYFGKKQFPQLLRIILYSLMALQQILLLVVIMFGFFDIWLDFRKLAANKTNNQEN